MMHAAELARIRQELGWDADRLTPAIAPGSTQEAHALALIDAARDEEQGRGRDTFAQRRAASARYWRKHARA